MSGAVRQPSEEAQAWWDRFNAAMTAGLTEEEATTFASDGDLEQLVKLVAAGCEPRMIARIVA